MSLREKLLRVAPEEWENEFVRIRPMTTRDSQRSRRRHIYLFNPEDMDNADIISMVENSPTYLRDKSTLNSIKMKAEQEGQLATEAAQEAEGGAGGVITFRFFRSRYVKPSSSPSGEQE